MYQDLNQLWNKLQKSPFRSKFCLNAKDTLYLQQKGLNTILTHANDFVEKRLACADPTNDGKQTPMRGHPVFVAQHATATCCRGCLAKWHHIAKGQALSEQEKTYIIHVIKMWLVNKYGDLLTVTNNNKKK